MTLVGFPDRLQARGLIVREDGRAKRVVVTAAAAEVLPRSRRIASAVRAEATAHLTASAVETLRAGLKTIRDNLLADSQETIEA